MNKVFIITGPIGVGKTTAIKWLKQNSQSENFVFIDEYNNDTDLDKYFISSTYNKTNINHNLRQMKANCDRYLATSYAASLDKDVILDRGFIDPIIFSTIFNYWNDNPQNDCKLALDFYLEQIKDFHPNVFHIILDCDASTILERVNQRNRDKEQGTLVGKIVFEFNDRLINELKQRNLPYTTINTDGLSPYLVALSIYKCIKSWK